MTHSSVSSRAGSCLALAFTTVALAGASAADTSSAGKHFLWRVTNAPAPFYILGSFHELRGSDYPLGAAIDNAIHESKRFIFEFDFKHALEAKWGKKLQDAAHYPRGVTLKQKVQPTTWAYLQKIAKVRESRYEDIRPWALALFMLHHPAFRGISSYNGVEGYVMRKSGASDVWGLETVDEHIHVLSDMSDMESEIFLLQALVYLDSSEKRFSDAVAAWKNGDVQRVYQTYASEEKRAPFLIWRLVDRRNAKWAPKLETAIKDGKPTMVVVGARHLCGPHSVISMLQARGYKLEQL
jgi:uncharacterized protein